MAQNDFSIWLALHGRTNGQLPFVAVTSVARKNFWNISYFLFTNLLDFITRIASNSIPPLKMFSYWKFQDNIELWAPLIKPAPESN